MTWILELFHTKKEEKNFFFYHFRFQLIFKCVMCVWECVCVSVHIPKCTLCLFIYLLVNDPDYQAHLLLSLWNEQNLQLYTTGCPRYSASWEKALWRYLFSGLLAVSSCYWLLLGVVSCYRPLLAGRCCRH